MKKQAILFLTLVLAACLAAGALAEARREASVDGYLGEWVGDGYRMYVRVENDEIFARLTEAEDDWVWEFDSCLFDGEDGILYGMNYVRYREYIDWDKMELVQEDWALGDLGFTSFTLSEDGEALTAADVPGVDEPFELRRVSDEADHGF